MKPYYQDEAVTIYHGDCREILPDLPIVDLVLTDPPYGINFNSGWTGSNIQGDSDTSLRDWLLTQILNIDALIFGAAGEAKLPGAKSVLIWHRPGSGMGDLGFPWKPDYELIHVFGTGFRSSYRGSSVIVCNWDTFRGDALHPHQKPVELIGKLILNHPAQTILDPFMGSGTTLRAAKDLNRQAIGIEIEERYCEIAANRMSQMVMAL